MSYQVVVFGLDWCHSELCDDSRGRVECEEESGQGGMTPRRSRRSLTERAVVICHPRPCGSMPHRYTVYPDTYLFIFHFKANINVK